MRIKIVKVKTFSKTLYDKKLNYYLSEKLDGQRFLLYIDNTGKIYKISTLNEKIFLNKINTKLANSVFDTELLNGTFYMFDTLVLNGLSIIEQSYSLRLSSTKYAKKLLNSSKFVLKKEYPTTPSSIYNCFKSLSKNVDGIKVDGIIFTPNTIYFSNVLKWKPTRLLSIDFKIKRINRNTIHLLTQNGNTFVPPKYLGLPSNMGIVKNTTYKDNQVVEFVVINKRFKPLRLRPDKVKSNHISVINSNLESIVNEPDISKIL